MRGSPTAVRLAAIACAAVAITTASRALAYEEQVTVGLELGYSGVLLESDLPRHGPVAGVSASIGLDDIWSLRGVLAYAFHPGDEPLHVAVAGAELLYLVDILELVPYFGGGVDGIATVFGGAFGAEPALHLVLGADWLLSREWLVGIDVRPYLLPLSLADAGVDPVYLTATLHAAMVFDL